MKPLTYMGQGFYLDRFHPGYLEVFYGPMRSGKGDSILRRIDRFNFSGGLEYIAFHPEEDKRTPGKIVSRIGATDQITRFVDAISIPGNDPDKLLNYIRDKHGLIVIDEAQFFNARIVHVVNDLLRQNRNVIVSGLNLDFRGEHFGQMSYFISHADMPHPLFASCAYMSPDDSGKIVPCSQRAQFTQRLIDGQPASYNSDVVVIEERKSFLKNLIQPFIKDVAQPEYDKSTGIITYEPRCRIHHTVPGRPSNGLKK
jgi:thymidine kinase